MSKKTQLKHSAFSWAVSVMQPFEVREGMEGEHTPEIDLTGRAFGGAHTSAT